jgi:hypothetical protein
MARLHRVPGVILLAGGLSIVIARTFKITAPDRKNPQTEDWQRAAALFNLFL